MKRTISDREKEEKEHVAVSSVEKSLKTPGELSNANFPMDAEGRVYHLAVKKGEVANRIVSVGDPARAQLLATTFMDNPDKLFIWPSKRGFTVYTGTRKGVPISIIATGMGISMIDFVVRETRAIVDGPMVIIRLGTCGTPQSNISIGSMAVATASIFIRRDSDAWFDNVDGQKRYYALSKPIPADPAVCDLLISNLKKHVNGGKIEPGLNATADSFYSSQGRIDNSFDDHNSSLMDDAIKEYPNLVSLEMETAQLLDLARTSKGTIRAAATTIVLAQRRSGAFLDHATMRKLELEGGEAVVDTVSQLPLTGTMNGPDCVWNLMK